MNKVLLIGLDGGSLDLINEWKNELPTINGFLEKGVYGKLESTIPPITSPAWNSMFTGKNPGKIGIFDFVVFPFNKERGFRVVNLTYQDSPSIWEILSRYNIKCSIINVPTAYPAKKVNGIMVCYGLLAPEKYTYPSTIREELSRVIKDWNVQDICDLSIQGKDDEFLEGFNLALDKQIKTVKYLMRKYDWDFSVNVFNIDTLQHYFWHYLCKDHPRWKLGRNNIIKSYYKRIDGVIGDLISGLSNETTIILVSDHGFGPLYGFFYVNEWLKEKGLLRLKRVRKISSNRVIAFGRDFLIKHVNPRLLERFAKAVPRCIKSKLALRNVEKDAYINLLSSIDWSSTKAYGLGNMGIFINLKGREPEGIVERGEQYEALRDNIIEILKKVRHPLTGKKIVSHVYKREEIYWGKHLDSAPDLIYFLDDMKYIHKTQVGFGKLWAESSYSGHHRLHGLFIAYGNYIKKTGEEIRNIKIYDVAPTILHIFGLPVPVDMDGRVLMDIFDANSPIAKKPVLFQKISEKEKIREKIYRLRTMGKI